MTLHPLYGLLIRRGGGKRPDQVQLEASGLGKEPGRIVTDLDAPVLEEPGTPTITASHVKLSDCGRKW